MDDVTGPNAACERQMMHITLAVRLVVLVALMMLPLSPDTAQTNTTVIQIGQREAYAILIDNTGSVRSQFGLVSELSKRIVEQTHQRGPISLYAFKTQGRMSEAVAVVSSGFGWSQDKTVLENHIDSLFVVPGQTAVRDGIRAMAEQLNARAAAAKEPLARVIVLITDGEDRVSKIGEKELIKTLKENSIKVYAIGLTSELENQGGLIGKGSRDRAKGFLEKLTKETGGRVVFHKSKKVDVEALASQLFAK
jgi:hypothetical protein